MKKLLLLFSISILFLSACVTTSVNLGDDREYYSQNKEACEKIDFVCDEGTVAFNDTTGCGCEDIDEEESNIVIEDESDDIDEEAVDEPEESEDPEPAVDVECGIVDGQQVSCDEGMCALVEGEEFPRCIPDNFCDDFCEEGYECIIMESYPVQIRCNEILEEEVAVDEEAIEESEEEEEVAEEEVIEEEAVAEEGVAEEQ